MFWVLFIWVIACLVVPRTGGRSYAWRTFLAIDQMVNVLFMNGDPDETISSNLAKNRDKWWGRFGCACLAMVDKDHCSKTIECDEGEKCDDAQ